MSTNLRITIMQKVATPPKELPEALTPASIIQKVQEYIADVNGSLVDSYWQWQYLKRLYNVLSKKPDLSKDEKAILYLLEPEMMKHGEYDVENAPELDGATMFRYSEEDFD